MNALQFREKERTRHDWGLPTKCDTQSIEEIRARRCATHFGGLNEYALARYGHIVSRFPGFQVYACGSQVRGDYVMTLPLLENDEINRARISAGMRVSVGSDFDFWVEPDAEQIGWLMDDCDRCRLRIPENEKIPLPMWDFSKLPIEAHEYVITLFNMGDWRELSKVHDRYVLSPYSYCCDETGLKNYFKHGIETGQIKAQIPKKQIA